jgi:predicted  nucleic acid-binding Zn-ribbon protein
LSFQYVPDQALIQQYRSILDGKDDEIAQLTADNQSLTANLEKIKKRYKLFRDLLDQVESRDKAQVISENIKLQRVQDELTAEMNTIRQENEKLKTKLADVQKGQVIFF